MAANTSVVDHKLDFPAISNGKNDIAKRFSHECMMTEATGRQPLQYSYLWTERGKSSSTPYNPKEDRRDDVKSYPKLPTEEERFDANNTKRYLEVGLVFGDEPSKYKPEKNQTKKSRAERKARGNLSRTEDVMRVFIPVTEYIQAQAKLYIGCHPVQGRLQPRTIQASDVFFYPEFWHDIDMGLDQKDRQQALMAKLRWYAAINKTSSGSITAVVTGDNPSPLTSTARYSAFAKFDKPFTDGEASKLAAEMKVNHPQMEPEPNPAMIKKIRDILCTDVEDGGASSKLGDQLQHGGLGFFLDACHIALSRGEYDDEVTFETVKEMIDVTAAYMRHKEDRDDQEDARPLGDEHLPVPPIQTPSIGPNESVRNEGGRNEGGQDVLGPAGLPSP